MKKRVFSLLFLTCILLGISACKPDAECMEPEESPRVETPDKHAFLMERGYPAEYLESLIDLQLESLYNMVIEEDAYFYEIEKGSQVFEEPVSDKLGSISTNDLDFTIVLSYTTYQYDNIQHIDQLIVNVDYHWNTLPSIRQVDEITVNWDGDYFNFDSRRAAFCAVDYAQTQDGNWVTYKSQTTPVEASVGGIRFIADIRYKDIYTGITRSAIGLRGSTSFRIDPAVTMKYVPEYSNVISTEVSANYVHNAGVPNFGIDCSTGDMFVTITNFSFANS